MFTRNNPNEAYIAGQVWRQAATPSIGILQELAAKLLFEAQSITNKGTRARINFGDGFKLHDQVQKFEIDMIRHALYLSGGRQNEAARLLGIKPTTLNSKMKRLLLTARRPSNESGARK